MTDPNQIPLDPQQLALQARQVEEEPARQTSPLADAAEALTTPSDIMDLAFTVGGAVIENAGTVAAATGEAVSGFFSIFEGL